MTKLINPNKKLFRWGPIEGRPIYPDYWHGGFVSFSKKYPPGWPQFLVYYQKDKMIAIGDWYELYDNGEKIFKKYILNDRKFKEAYKKWEEMLNNFIEMVKKVQSEDLKKLSRKELLDLFRRWNKLYGIDFWDIGSLPELANWGGEQLLLRELKKKINDEGNLHLAMEKLSAPEDFSFYQKEELDLLSLKKNKTKKTLLEKLKTHQQNYFWLLNSYHHTKILPVSHFKKVLSSFSDASAKMKIAEMNKLKNKAISHKKQIVRKFGLSREILKIGQRLAFCVWWQDIRKSYIFQANHIVDLFLKEISRRDGVGFNNLHYLGVKETERVLESDSRFANKEINERKTAFFIIYDQKGGHYIAGKKAKAIFKPYLKQKVDRRIKEFKGVVVSRGKVAGFARIVHGPAEIDKMKKGDILVASMTAPDYIMGLKRAAAVVTDEGGMTCHAAIVSRELKIPGIVGTKISTQVLKDGDLVEVDAERGIVKIID